MPALILFRRKWLIACDDFVIPSAIEAFIRLMWLLAAFLMAFLNTFDCTDGFVTKCLLYAIVGDLFCTSCLCLFLSILSSRGSVLEVQKRVHLPKFLYIKCMTVIIEVAIASFSVWQLQQEINFCPHTKIFILVTTTCTYLYLLVVIIGIFICYNSLGSSQYWNTKNSANSSQLLKKAEKIWRFRLKFFCCCADVSEEENDFVYVEISSFITSLSKDIDATPTDVLAGLIVLSKKHAIERRKPLFQKSLNFDDFLVNRPVISWMTAENALYFLRVAKSTYGWMAFCDPLQPWKMCTLISSERCFGRQDSRKHGDCFYCNSTAVKLITGYSDSEILYASFRNSIYEPAFVVVLDHTKKSLIIAIRGTGSFSDFITDLDGEQFDFPSLLKCHRGALRSALYIQRKIYELNILKIILAENPSYNLVLCGHSLGGSIAAILSKLLHLEYPSLQCYAYAPLPVVSCEGVFQTLDFVFTIAVEDDMVVRMSANSIKELRKEMCVSLKETHMPKYKLLLKAFQFYLKKHLKISKKPILCSSPYENKGAEINESPVEIEINQSCNEQQINVLPDPTRLYTPGRILHLKRGETCGYSWITGFSLHKIIISPYVIKDHQPHNIQLYLEKIKPCMESNETIEPEDIHTKL